MFEEENVRKTTVPSVGLRGPARGVGGVWAAAL